QAVAARTYAVRNLGQFRTEGYDICPGPACQAYKGFTGEEPLSDQAVKETAGLIATYNGQPIDALFTSTCGGETSDVGTMFPGRNEPYLKAARCVELDIKTITGRADSAVMMTEAQANGRIFAELAGLTGPAASWAAGDVEQAVTAAAAMLRYGGPGFSPASPAAGLKPGLPVRATSSRRGDVLTYLAAVFGFDRYASVVTLPADIPIFRRLGDRLQEYKTVPVMIGDRAFIYTNPRKVPVAMIVNANYDGASFDRTSSFANWTRSFRADELVASINRRQPIKQLLGLRPLVVDKSQRIAEMEVTAEGGRTFVLKGLPIRWSLN